MEFLMSETKVLMLYLQQGMTEKKGWKVGSWGEELELEVCSVLRKIREDM